MSPLPKEPGLGRETQRDLLKLARAAIVEAVGRNGLPAIPSDVAPLTPRSGVFVTLRNAGRLRGCIGNIEPVASLGYAVASCAVSAALYDPRFPPVVPEETAQLEIEISVLSPLQPIQPASIEVGRHGIMVRQRDVRAVLLPQVASERGWTREQFLDEVCRKAGLPANAWTDTETQLSAFETEIFRESDFDGPTKAHDDSVGDDESVKDNEPVRDRGEDLA